MNWLNFIIFTGSNLIVSVIQENISTDNNDAIVRSLFLQRSGVPSADSWAKLQTPFPELNDFSICYRIRMHRYREESTLMSYAISDSKDNELRMDHRDSGFKVSIYSTWAETNIVTLLGRWTHYCITFESSSDAWKIYEDGQLKAEGFITKHKGPIEGGGAYIIGQEQDSLGRNFQRDQSFSGEISELNFWSRVIDQEFIKEVFSCKTVIEGDSLAWSEMQWEIAGESEWINRNRTELCDTPKRRLAVFPFRFNLKSSQSLCNVIGGTLAVPRTNKENTQLYEISKNYSGYCSGNLGTSYLWLGADDIENEGSWVYSNTNISISWDGPWRGGNPNGGTLENCLVMLTHPFPAIWSDIACFESYYYCVPCEIEEEENLYLKGPALCSTTPFNSIYFIEGMRNDQPLIVGKMHTEIFWDNTNNTWVLQSLKDSAAVAKCTPNNGHFYPFGKHYWTMDSSVCGIEPGKEVLLTLSACGEEEFTCMDGSCIPLALRCDLRLDCLDNSDETDCSILEIPSGYNKIIPPPSQDVGKPLSVLFNINILSFPAIKTQDLVFETSLQLKLKWRDLRLNYKNLKDDKSLNTISNKAIDQIWKPTVFFSNAYGNIYTNTNEGATVQCIPEGAPVLGSNDNVEEMIIYAGNENWLEMSQLYQASYSCDFDLAMFPFDAQVCSLDFNLVSGNSRYMVLIPEESIYSGNKEMIEYGISGVSMNHSLSRGVFSKIRVSVRFTRRYGFYLLTLYIPTVLLVIIAYATLFFDPKDFNSRIVVALAALLVLSSLFTQTSNSLPKTSYFKLVDIWLFCAIVFIFIIVLCQTIAEFFSYDNLFKEKHSSNKLSNHHQNFIKVQSRSRTSPQFTSLNKTGILDNEKPTLFGLKINIFVIIVGRIFTPILYVIFNFAYWGTAVNYLITQVWDFD